jgi:hypothetical protein
LRISFQTSYDELFLESARPDDAGWRLQIKPDIDIIQHKPITDAESMPGRTPMVLVILLMLAGGCRSMDYSILRMDIHTDDLYGSGSLTGFITDSRGEKPLVMALVTLEGTQQAAMTDSIGHYRIDNLRPGHYCAGVEVLRFKKVICCPVEIGSNQTVRLDLGLEAAAVPSQTTR